MQLKWPKSHSKLTPGVKGFFSDFESYSTFVLVTCGVNTPESLSGHFSCFVVLGSLGDEPGYNSRADFERLSFVGFRPSQSSTAQTQ